MSNDEGLRRLLRLVNFFLTRPDCEPFREPVDWRALDLFDYPKIIKKPMDLGTIKRKLERGLYKSLSECADDFRLVWSNCKTYNQDGSDFYLLADNLSKKFEDRFMKICTELGISVADNSTNRPAETMKVSLEEKTRFASALFRLSGVELGHVMQVLDLKCPQAFEPLDPADDESKETKIEINVDVIDVKTFLELDTYVKQKLLDKVNDDEAVEDAIMSDKKPKHKRT